MTLDDALAQLKSHVEPGRAEGMRAYHKVDRVYLGVANGPLDDLAKEWRRSLTIEERVALADALWRSDIYEARVVAAKLLTQARIKDDGAVWDLICSWVPDFDSWAIADHASMAGQRRLAADPSRIADVEGWTTAEHLWTKRAALVVTLPFTKSRDASEAEIALRERVLSWAAAYVEDQRWFIQKAVAWWLRDLSKRDPARVQAFLDQFGEGMKNFARKEASKYL